MMSILYVNETENVNKDSPIREVSVKLFIEVTVVISLLQLPRKMSVNTWTVKSET